MTRRKRVTDRERSERPRRDFTPSGFDLEIDGQYVHRRCMRGRKSKYVRRVLRAFGVERCESCAMWEEAQHLLFWELLGYDGRWYSWEHGLPGMIGETKRLIAEVMRP